MFRARVPSSTRAGRLRVMSLASADMTRCRLAWLALPLAAAFSQAASDIDGAADPSGLERFPGSWIVAYSANAEQRSYEFVTGRVDRSRRDLRVDASRRLAAQLVRVTYQAPEGARLDDVVAHYRGLIADRQAAIAFECEGRDCGRSTAWANGVFGVKELVAPDASQFYLAATFDDWLAAIYVVQRGNRRVYAHVDLARGEQLAERNTELADRLLRRGFAVLPVAPDATGRLDGPALAALDEIAAQLADVGERPLAVVCHLDGAAEFSITPSQACAEQAAERLRAAGLDVAGFGGGALLPRPGAAARRLELVLPNTDR